MAQSYRPDLYQHLLGKTFVDRSHRPLLVFNGTSYTKYDLGEIGIPHQKAARTLDTVLRRLGITTPAELARRIHELPGIKMAGLTLASCALALLYYEGKAKEGVSTWNAEQIRVPKKGQEGKDVARVPVTYGTAKRRMKQVAIRNVGKS